MTRTTGTKGGLVTRTGTVRTRSVRLYEGVDRCKLSLLGSNSKVLARYGTNRLTASGCNAKLNPLVLNGRGNCAFRTCASRAEPLLRNTELADCRLRGDKASIRLVYSGVTDCIVGRKLVSTILMNYSEVTTGKSTTGGVNADNATVLTGCCNVPFCILKPCSAISFSAPANSSVRVRVHKNSRVGAVFFRGPATLPRAGYLGPTFSIASRDLVATVVASGKVICPPFNRGLGGVLGANRGRS